MGVTQAKYKGVGQGLACVDALLAIPGTALTLLFVLIYWGLSQAYGPIDPYETALAFGVMIMETISGGYSVDLFGNCHLFMDYMLA